MATTAKTVSPGSDITWWQAFDMDCPELEDLMEDATGALIFDVRDYSRAIVTVTNHDPANAAYLSAYVTNFDDPGDDFAADFGEDSLWVHARDQNDDRIEVELPALGEPDSNEIFVIDVDTRFLAFTIYNGVELDEDCISMSIKFIKRTPKRT